MNVTRFLIAVLLTGTICSLGMFGIAEARTAPDFRAQTMEGKNIQFSTYLDQGPVLVDFWATWCVPCLKEMKELQKLYEEYQDRGFEILAVSIDNPRTSSKIKPTVISHGFTFPILLDPNKEILKKLGGKNVVPYLVLISPDGEIITTYEGYKAGNEKVIEKAILPYLEQVQVGGDESEGTTD